MNMTRSELIEKALEIAYFEHCYEFSDDEIRANVEAATDEELMEYIRNAE